MAAQIIDTRTASALFKDAAISPLTQETLGAMGVSLPAHAFLAGVAAAYGGVWTPGTATLTSEALRFEPSSFSRLVMANPDTLSLELPLTNIRSIGTRRIPGFFPPDPFGFIRGIIDISDATGSVSLSCGKSEAFAQAIRRTAGLG